MGFYMDIKAMLVKLAEEQADKMAQLMNDKINIPFVAEEKEQVFFEEMMDVVTDLLEGIFKGK